MASQMNSLKKKNSRSKPYNSYLKYSGLAIQMLVTIGIMAFLGYKIDTWIGITFPAFLLTFTFVAFGGMIYQLHKTVRKEDSDE